MATKTQLTDIHNYDINNIIFSKPEQGSIPNTPISFHRVHLSTKNPDGSIGELIVSTEQLFSFGLQENTDMSSGLVNGYSVPLCLYSKTGVTDKEKSFCNKFTEIVDACKEHIISVKEELGKYDLEMSDLKKFNPMYWKREKGVVDESKGPTLYPKVIVSKKNGLKINTFFTDAETGEDVDPITLLKKYMNCVCGLKIESIFIGNKISLQIKVYECMFSIIDTGMKRLLSRPVRQPTLSFENEEGDQFNQETDEEIEEGGSINGEDDDEEEEVEQIPEPEPEPEPEKPKKGKRKTKAKK